MYNVEKFWTAIIILKSDVECTVNGNIETEDDYNNNILWKTGTDGETSISTKTNPHPELTWEKVNAEMTRLQAEYDSLAYARKRAIVYPSTKDFMEAYTEKEIGGNSTKWDAYVINYNKVRSENPK